MSQFIIVCALAEPISCSLFSLFHFVQVSFLPYFIACSELFFLFLSSLLGVKRFMEILDGDDSRHILQSLDRFHYCLLVAVRLVLTIEVCIRFDFDVYVMENVETLVEKNRFDVVFVEFALQEVLCQRHQRVC